MIVTIVALTHSGKIREKNEDTIAVGHWICSASNGNPIRIINPLNRPLSVLIADGMGGHNAGEIASHFVAEKLVELLADANDDVSIRHALQVVNRGLYEKMETSPSFQGMGSTVVGALLTPASGWIFHVGDSRAYQVRDGFLAQLTHDDTLSVARYGECDLLNKSGIISQALGGAKHYVEISPNVQAMRLSPGTTWLFCSDGLSDMLSLDDLEAAMQFDIEMSVTKLLERALQAGGHDNISIIMLQIDGDEDSFNPH